MQIFSGERRRSAVNYTRYNGESSTGICPWPRLIYDLHGWLFRNTSHSTFADDTAILASSNNPIAASALSQNYLNEFNGWIQNWRIKTSTTKSRYNTFILRRRNWALIKMHFNKKLTWKTHIKSKRDELNMLFRNLKFGVSFRSFFTE